MDATSSAARFSRLKLLFSTPDVQRVPDEFYQRLNPAFSGRAHPHEGVQVSGLQDRPK